MSNVDSLALDLTGSARALFTQMALNANGVPQTYLNNCSAASLANALQAVLDVVKNDLIAVLRSWNANNARLPPELLLGVFAHAGIHDRFTATHVCHQWRDTALASRSLWADIRDFDYMSHRVPIALDRAHPRPVDLEVWLATNFDRNSCRYRMDLTSLTRAGMGKLERHVLSSIRAHLSTIRSLSLTMPRLSDEIVAELTTPAPILEHLELSASDSVLSERRDLFSGVAPRLSILQLKNVALPLNSFIRATVRHLHVYHSQKNAGLLHTMHASMPNLERYYLRVPGRLTRSPPPTLAPAPNLRELFVVVDSATAVQIMAFLPHSACARVAVSEIAMTTFGTLVQDLPDVSYLVVRNVSLSNIPEYGCIAADRSRKRTRSAHSMRFHVGDTASALLISPAIGPHLRYLVLDAALRKQPQMVLLPNLRYLQIIVAFMSGINIDAAPDPDSTLYEQLPLWIVAPHLRVLRLTGTPAESRDASKMYSAWEDSYRIQFMASLLGPGSPGGESFEVEHFPSDDNVPTFPSTIRQTKFKRTSQVALDVANCVIWQRDWDDNLHQLLRDLPAVQEE